MNYNIFVGFIAWIGILERNPDGSARLRFTVAVKNSAKQNSTSFVDCTAFGKRAELLSNYCVKGSPIGIEAEVRNNNYLAKNGNMQYTYNFVVKQVHFVGKKESNPAVAMRAQAASATAPPASGALPFPPAPSTQPVPSAAPPMTAADADGLGQGLKLGKLEDVFDSSEMTFGTAAEAR